MATEYRLLNTDLRTADVHAAVDSWFRIQFQGVYNEPRSLAYEATVLLYERYQAMAALALEASALLPLLAGAAGATGNDDWMEQADDLATRIGAAVQVEQPQRLHTWARRTPAEPLACTTCGLRYADPDAAFPCSGGGA